MINFFFASTLTVSVRLHGIGGTVGNCTSCVGFCVSFGDLFFTNGIKEIDEIILPHLTTQAGVDVIPCVLPSYAILHRFTVQVSNEFLKNEIHFLIIRHYITIALELTMIF